MAIQFWQQHGADSSARILRAVIEGNRRFEESFREVTGGSVAEFEAAWRASLGVSPAPTVIPTMGFSFPPTPQHAAIVTRWLEAASANFNYILSQVAVCG